LEAFKTLVAAFHDGLREWGYVEGQNLTVDYRWAEGAYDRLPALAVELARRPVNLIFTAASPALLAAKAATSSIPIVFTSGGDPVKLGFVSSLSRPGGNVTGVSFLVDELGAKRLELLRALIPTAASIGFLANTKRSTSDAEMHDTQQAAQLLGAQVHVVDAGSDAEIAAAFARFGELRVGAVMIGTDPFFHTRYEQIVALSAGLRVPVMYGIREYVLAGGLMSYAPSLPEAYRQAGVYAARILKGARPTELPVVQPTKFELLINLKTAKALGLDVPPRLLALADEVIE
jgi:putative ABC transport system substrate-binding protein